MPWPIPRDGTLPPIGETIRVLKAERGAARHITAAQLRSSAVEAAGKVVASDTPLPKTPSSEEKLEAILREPPPQPLEPGKRPERKGPHLAVDYQRDAFQHTFSAVIKDLVWPYPKKQKDKRIQAGFIEPQVSVASKPQIPESLKVQPPLPDQLQLAWTTVDLHFKRLGEDFIELTLAPQFAAQFPDFDALQFGGQAQVELHINEELSLYAQTEVALQPHKDEPLDFNSTRIGTVHIQGRAYDAVWQPITIGILIHIGAGGPELTRGEREPTPRLSRELREAAASIDVNALLNDPDINRPEFRSIGAGTGPESTLMSLMPELIRRIIDKMVSGAAANERIRELSFPLPPGMPTPPRSFQAAIEKIVDVVSIAGHYAPLAGFDRFELFLVRGNYAIGEYHVLGLGRRAGAD
jgi:hypothetical protein